MNGYIKTFMLLAALTTLFIFVGFAIGGEAGAIIAFVFAFAMNIFAYWNSDKIVLKMYKAKEISRADYPRLFNVINQLSINAQIPIPKAYVIENPQPNAFVTGRNPENGAIALTTGIMKMLNEKELAGVIAHELAHIKNRDTLIMTITATIAGAISMLANMAFFMSAFGGRGRGNPIIMIIVAILAPIAAALVQMAISRSREYQADKIGAEICGDPVALADALKKISSGAQKIDNDAAEDNPATAHMFIINPLHERSMDNLFSTHPNTENRISALMDLAKTSNFSNRNNNIARKSVKKGTFDV